MIRIIAYGYKVKDGEIIVDEIKANIIREMANNYLNGIGLQKCGKLAGFLRSHAQIKNLIINSKYAGTDVYPAIYEEGMYERLLEEYEKRKIKKTRRITNTKSYTKIFKNFIMNYTEKKIDNPKLQAEFSYSLIQGDTYE